MKNRRIIANLLAVSVIIHAVFVMAPHSGVTTTLPHRGPSVEPVPQTWAASLERATAPVPASVSVGAAIKPASPTPYAADEAAATIVVPTSAAMGIAPFLAANGLAPEQALYEPRLGAYVVEHNAGSLQAAGARVYPRRTYQASRVDAINDPLVTGQKALAAVNAAGAWTQGDGSGQTVAVIDTGFALDHQDLAGTWATNPNERSGSSDTDGNGYAGDWRGYDFVHDDADPRAGTTSSTAAGVSHGTMVAGIIAARAGNGVGVAGLAPGARVLPLQALDDDGAGYTDDIAAAIVYATDAGVRIINLSLGGRAPDDFLRLAIDYAVDHGAMVVAASGNDGAGSLSYPAAYPETVSVGAVDQAGIRATFSNYGPGLDLVAPGTGICSAAFQSANRTAAYACGDGTSFAAPLVAAATALARSAYPDLGITDITRLLAQSARKNDQFGSSSYNVFYGSGSLDAVTMVTLPALITARNADVAVATIPLKSNHIAACFGLAGSTCHLVATNRAGNTMDLGTRQIDAFGSALFLWTDQTQADERYDIIRAVTP